MRRRREADGSYEEGLRPPPVSHRLLAVAKHRTMLTDHNTEGIKASSSELNSPSALMGLRSGLRGRVRIVQWGWWDWSDQKELSELDVWHSQRLLVRPLIRSNVCVILQIKIRLSNRNAPERFMNIKRNTAKYYNICGVPSSSRLTATGDFLGPLFKSRFFSHQNTERNIMFCAHFNNPHKRVWGDQPVTR